MQLSNEQRIFVVTNYLKTRRFKEVQQLFEQRFRDGVSPTEMTIWKIVKKYKTERLSINLNKDRHVAKQNVHRKRFNYLLQEKLIEDSRILARKNGSNISNH